ncbi:MAG: (2Fe-2S)-binding protein [Deltaproteobacteria bacterium]|nr:(2Fe-2S)-binding protein [Deltaproteobacteria bacterium]
MKTRETITIRLQVNGVEYERGVEPRLLLCDFLRESLGLTGTHVGCEHGICGSCTVMVNGSTVRSCLMFAVQANGTEVTTIEGLAEGAKLHPLQEAFSEHHGLQCGFCTPGMLFSALELLKDNPQPTDQEIREGIAGNICRCTGYYHIVQAVKAAAEQMAQEQT